MGGKNRDFQVPFIIIVLIIGLIAAILCSLGIVNICEYINGLVIERLAEAKELPQLLNLKLLQLSPSIIIYDLIILFGLILVSVLFPILALRKIKLVDILRRE
jgi:ABC-type antimicrobial peptide transport system permease subunit